MADIVWTGAAAKVTMLRNLAIGGTWLAGETITLTIGVTDFIITIGTLVTTAQVATTIKQLFNGETPTDTTASGTVAGGARVIPEFMDVALATNAVASNVAFPGVTAGKPFTLTGTTNSASGTLTWTTPVAATGPNFADNSDNFSAAGAHGDRLIFQSGNVDCLYNLTLSWQPSEIVVTKGYRGRIGLAAVNKDRDSYPYAEYRGRYLTSGADSGASSCSIGYGEGQGSQRINISFGAVEFSTTVYSSAGREDTAVPTINLIGTNSANSITNLGGDVGYAFLTTEASHLSVVRNSGPNAKTYLGTGVDIDNAEIVCTAGYLELNSETTASSSIAASGGVLVINTGNHLAITASGKAKVVLRNASFTITTLVVYEATVLKETAGEVTITNVLELYRGATITAPDGNLTLTAGFQTNGCGLRDVIVDLGSNHTYTVSA